MCVIYACVQPEKNMAYVCVALFHQKHIRIQDAKSVEEKAAKIKEWVMLKLSEVNQLWLVIDMERKKVA